MIQDFKAFRKKVGLRVFNAPEKIWVKDDTYDASVYGKKDELYRNVAIAASRLSYISNLFAIPAITKVL